jgi:hypothetical protein
MKLDQFAYSPENAENPEFIWRKHAKLQEFMESLFVLRTGKDDTNLNRSELGLTVDDIQMLEALVKTGELPVSKGGFFYGHQFQDESAQEYRDQDLAFCEWAKAILKTREKVIYSCWW